VQLRQAVELRSFSLMGMLTDMTYDIEFNGGRGMSDSPAPIIRVPAELSLPLLFPSCNRLGATLILRRACPRGSLWELRTGIGIASKGRMLHLGDCFCFSLSLLAQCLGVGRWVHPLARSLRGWRRLRPGCCGSDVARFLSTCVGCTVLRNHGTQPRLVRH
jgi:hypothetical protein